jgi:hypothetical protein
MRESLSLESDTASPDQIGLLRWRSDTGWNRPSITHDLSFRELFLTETHLKKVILAFRPCRGPRFTSDPMHFLTMAVEGR